MTMVRGMLKIKNQMKNCVFVFPRTMNVYWHIALHNKKNDFRLYSIYSLQERVKYVGF